MSVTCEKSGYWALQRLHSIKNRYPRSSTQWLLSCLVLAVQEELHDFSPVYRAWDESNQQALNTQLKLDEVRGCVNTHRIDQFNVA
eukprot:1161140-Pelagomonas_calceolata.AAC.7